MIDNVTFLNRQCRIIFDTEQSNVNYSESERTLSVRDLSQEAAFVLLGEPGMGKTSSLEALEEHLGGECISAQDFILEDSSTLKPDQFYCVDALDEARVNADSTTFKEIRKLIYQAKLTHFCISCRIADWLETDTKEIQYIAPNKRLKVVELLPLSKEETTNLLIKSEVNDPDTFIDQAEQLGFADMLGNPKSIEILAAAVKQNNQQWPKKRTQAYELACISLLHEHNDYHLQAQRDRPQSNESLLEAAGWLCSLLLLSNHYAISSADIGIGKASNNTLWLESVINESPSNNSNLTTTVLKRRLFQRTANRHYPIHRTIAEYLAARYLSKLIQQNTLLAERISTLLLASPMHLITNLRGLAGWLAALSSPIRQKIFVAEPASVLDYGDLHLLSNTDKQELIQYLAASSSFNYSSYRWRQGERYAPLVHSNMQSFVIDWLLKLTKTNFKNKASSVKLPQTLTANTLLYALEKKNKSEYWEPMLKLLLQSTEVPTSLKHPALSALWKHSENPAQSYLGIFHDIHTGKIQDKSKGLRGDILYKIYPKYLSPEQMLKYFSPPDKYNFNSYSMFWDSGLIAKTTSDQLLEWMDALAQALEDGLFEQDDDGLYYNQRKEFSSIILSSIEMFGAEQTPERLARWLSWCVFDNQTPFSTLNHEEFQKLKRWKENHSSIIQNVIAYRLRVITPPHMADYKISDGADLPNMGAFWLNQAKLLLNEVSVDEHLKRSATALNNAISYLKKNDKPEISLNDIENVASLSSELKEVLDERQKYNTEDNWNSEFLLAEKKRVQKQEQLKQNLESRLALLLSQLDKIRSGQHLQFLYHAAWAELPENYINNSEHDWIIESLKRYPELHKATQEGYQTCLKKLTRQDIAKSSEAREKNQRLLIELPAYLGAKNLFQESPSRFISLSDEILEALCTLYLSNSSDSLAEWLIDLSEKKFNLVSEVWWGVYRNQFKKKPSKDNNRLPFIHALYNEPRLASLANELLPKALTHWPLKISNANLFGFTDLLIAMIHKCPEKLSELIEHRLQKKSIGAIQRAHLVMAGLWVAPDKFTSIINSLLKKKVTSRNPYLSFIAYANRYGVNDQRTLTVPDWGVEVKALAFQLLAPLFPPNPPERTIWTPDHHDDGRDFLRMLNESFFTDLSENGLKVIKSLKYDKTLTLWEGYLDRLLSRYATALAEKNFTTPTPLQVAGVLQNKSPVNHSDLMALAIEGFSQLQKEIRNSPTDLIHRFWQVDSNAQKAIPPHRPETECRNVIADWLQAHLQNYGITLLPELLHGAGNQSDIGLLVQIQGQADLLLPIEVKGDWNKSKGGRDVWHAAKNQLYDKYVTDPRCGGLGLYLVLWMGERKKGDGGHTDEAYIHPNHPNIKTPELLQMALIEEASKLLGEAANQIKIVVLDLSVA